MQTPLSLVSVKRVVNSLNSLRSKPSDVMSQPLLSTQHVERLRSHDVTLACCRAALVSLQRRMTDEAAQHFGEMLALEGQVKRLDPSAVPHEDHDDEQDVLDLAPDGQDPVRTVVQGVLLLHQRAERRRARREKLLEQMRAVVAAAVVLSDAVFETTGVDEPQQSTESVVAAPTPGMAVAERLRAVLRQKAVRPIDLLRQMDADGDGQLSRGEFARGLRALGLKAAARDIAQAFAFFADGKDHISQRDLNSRLRSGVDLPIHPSLKPGAAGAIDRSRQTRIPQRRAPARAVSTVDGARARSGGLTDRVLAPSQFELPRPASAR